VKLNTARDVWLNLTPENPTPPGSAASLETKRCHALENRNKDLLAVQDLKVKLSISVRWPLDCGVESSSAHGGEASLPVMLG
jgi:hypothetical protein